MTKRSLLPLATIFVISGIWDIVAGVMYLFFIGTNRTISVPPVDPFYSIFLASFFFCFAYLQFLSAYNIRRYAFIVGCLIFGRAFYVVQLYLFTHFVNGFPSTFAFTGVIDGLITVLYVIFAFWGGLRFRDLFFLSKI